MASPLSMFRRHQFILMVGLVFVAMGSFVIAPSIDEYLRSRTRAESGVDDVIVTFDGGRFLRSDIDRMRTAHNLAVAYLGAIVQETFNRNGTPRGRGISQSMFGQIVDPGIPSSDTDQSLVYTALMAEKAEDLGMVVSDEAVIEFLEQLSGGVIPRGDFGAIFDESLGKRVTQEFLIDQLKTELLAQRMRETMAAGLLVAPRGAVAPAKAWDYFSRLNRKVQAELVALKLSDFYDELKDEPTDQELQAIFREGQGRFPDPLQPEPGFKRRRQASFQFARAELNTFIETEKAQILPGLTDEEIEKYYEDNKQKYIVVAPPAVQESPVSPEETDDPADGSESTPADEAPADETPADEAPVDEAPVDETPADEATANEEQVPSNNDSDESAEKDADGDTAPEPGADDQSGLTASTLQLVAFNQEDEDPAQEDPAQEDPADEAPKADEPTDTAATEAAPEPPKEAGVPESADPAGEDTANADEADPAAVAEETSETAETPAEEKPVEYRPLDDELRNEIRETLAEQNARKPAQDRLTAALSKVEDQVNAHLRKVRRHNRRVEAGEESDEELTFSFSELDSDELLDMGETPLVDALSVQEYELGGAYEMQWTSTPRRFEFAEFAFLEDFPLYTAARMSGATAGVTFLFWKTENKEPYEPSLDEARDEVTEAWKKQQALVLAEKAAEKLIEEARAKKGTRLTEIFADREDVKVTTTDLFSWMSTGLNPMSLGAPAVSNLENVEGEGPTFMGAVFALGVDEVGTAKNQGEDTLYVVRINLESPSEEILRQRFLSSGVTFEVAALADAENTEARTQWYEDLESQLNVRWVEEEE